MIPSEPSAANAITTFLIFAIPSLFCPIAICTHPRITIANQPVRMRVMKILVNALDIQLMELLPSGALPSLFIHLPIKGKLVLRTIPQLHLQSQNSVSQLHLSLHSFTNIGLQSVHGG